MLHRADGLIGFPGGMQDEGESPSTTAVREAYEELGVELNEGALIEHAALRETRGLIVRTFTYPTTYEALLDAQRNQQSGHHFGAEISGAILPHLVDYGDHGWEGGLLNILSSPAPETVPHEISILLQLLGYYGTDKIRQLSAQLGYPLAKVDPNSV
jgi:8-oxo-dGTP pyrophosphatase MutT (NUDIX family)